MTRKQRTLSIRRNNREKSRPSSGRSVSARDLKRRVSRDGWEKTAEGRRSRGALNSAKLNGRLRRCQSAAPPESEARRGRPYRLLATVAPLRLITMSLLGGGGTAAIEPPHEGAERARTNKEGSSPNGQRDAALALAQKMLSTLSGRDDGDAQFMEGARARIGVHVCPSAYTRPGIPIC